jgi:hypothetical protein
MPQAFSNPGYAAGYVSAALAAFAVAAMLGFFGPPGWVGSLGALAVGIHFTAAGLAPFGRADAQPEVLETPSEWWTDFFQNLDGIAPESRPSP